MPPAPIGGDDFVRPEAGAAASKPRDGVILQPLESSEGGCVKTTGRPGCNGYNPLHFMALSPGTRIGSYEVLETLGWPLDTRPELI